MSGPKQAIRYCQAANGMSIAWSSKGSGPALVLCAMVWNVERQFGPNCAFPLWAEIAEARRLVMYDGLGSGLSDRSFEDISVENSVADLAAVVDAAGLGKFAICATCMGAQAAISYAAAHPDRVERMVLIGGFARGLLHRQPTAKQIAQRELMLEALEIGWDDPIPAFRLLDQLSAFPQATLEEQLRMTEMLRSTTSGRNVVRYFRAQGEGDVSSEARRVQCPTLIAHARDSARIPFDEGCRLAGLIPNARFLPLDGKDALPMASSPSFRIVVDAARAFLQEGELGATGHGLGVHLTPRECEVLELIAQGLDNLQIAAHLGLSEKTVRNHITPIFDKLSVDNRSRAIVKAREAGLGLRRA